MRRKSPKKFRPRRQETNDSWLVTKYLAIVGIVSLCMLSWKQCTSDPKLALDNAQESKSKRDPSSSIKNPAEGGEIRASKIDPHAIRTLRDQRHLVKKPHPKMPGAIENFPRRSPNSQYDKKKSLTEIAREKQIPTLSPMVSSDLRAGKKFVDDSPCTGESILLENAKVYTDQAIGSPLICQITLPSLSYIKVIGQLTLTARRVVIAGVINGNADENGGRAAASVNVESGFAEISGAIELRGTPRLESVSSFDYQRGGSVSISSKRVKITGLINVAGASPVLNGNVKIDYAHGSESVIVTRNILNSNNFSIRKLASL